MIDSALRRELFKALAKSLLCLLLIPALALAFTAYVQTSRDASFLQRVEARVGPAPTPQDAQVLAFYRAHPPSSLCGNTDPGLAEGRSMMCATFSPAWQFHVVRLVSFWTLVAGGALLAAILALGALAFVNRQWQYASFLAGSRLLALASAASVTVQGALGVWLSFWVTAHFFQKYFAQLILIVALAVGAAVWVVVRGIFNRLPQESELEGELLTESDAPRLWQRVRELAARLPTPPPDHIVAGIDNNFFVTEAPMRVGDQPLRGRTLFVSIPLLRVLDTAQADAVLAHELAHLGGGDTASSALLGPQLRRYDVYLQTMGAGGFTRVAYPVMHLYRLVFELALARESREREFRADRVAAGLVSAEAIVHSLIKISAYSRYRASVEEQLFGRNEKLAGSLGIAATVASGLQSFAGSESFLDAMKTADVPHPFDSHPATAQRMANVAHPVPEHAWPAVVQAAPAASWADDILNAADIESRLWAGYEEAFAGHHEVNLAYRLEPATEAEREIVLRHFPPQRFELGKGQVLTVSIDGIAAAKDDVSIAWDEVSALGLDHTAFIGDYLLVTLQEKGLVLKKKQKIRLPGLKKRKPEVSAVLSQYWQRHQFMRAHQAQMQSPD